MTASPRREHDPKESPQSFQFAFSVRLPASAINLGIAFGSVAGGVAFGAFSTSAAVVTGLILAAASIAAAWATSVLKPPTVEQPADPTAERVLEAA